MPHQCTKCGIVFPDASEEILTGCTCGSRFFYYINQAKLDSLEEENEMQEKIEQLDRADKIQIEKDIREISGLEDEPDKPVILDLESVKVLEPGKFEIDIINLFSKKRPLIYKLEEGKYIIDLSGSFKKNQTEIDKKIRDPDLLTREEKVERVTSKKPKQETKEEYLDLTDESPSEETQKEDPQETQSKEEPTT